MRRTWLGMRLPTWLLVWIVLGTLIALSDLAIVAYHGAHTRVPTDAP